MYNIESLDTMFFEYEQKLEDIRGNIYDMLDLVKPHQLLAIVKAAKLGALYDILSENDHLESFEDVFYPDQLAVLCHNYNAVSQAIDSHHRAQGSVRIDLSTRHKLNSL